MPLNLPAFFLSHRAAFGPLRQAQVEGLEWLLGAFAYNPLWADHRHTAYALATIRRETGIMVKQPNGLREPMMYLPIAEVGSRTYLAKYWFKPSIRRALGNLHLSDAWTYKGRGYVQITGRANYTRFENLLGVPLLATPDLALRRDIAFAVMTRGMHEGLFTGKALSDYIGLTVDYYNARRIINGVDHAGYIARDAETFERILRNCGYNT